MKDYRDLPPRLRKLGAPVATAAAKAIEQLLADKETLMFVLAALIAREDETLIVTKDELEKVGPLDQLAIDWTTTGGIALRRAQPSKKTQPLAPEASK